MTLCRSVCATTRALFSHQVQRRLPSFCVDPNALFLPRVFFVVVINAQEELDGAKKSAAAAVQAAVDFANASPPPPADLAKVSFFLSRVQFPHQEENFGSRCDVSDKRRPSMSTSCTREIYAYVPYLWQLKT